MLKSPLRKATATASPASTSGIVWMSVSVMSYGLPKAPRNRSTYAEIGSWPEARTKSAPIASATTTETTGTAGPVAHCAVG